MNPLLTAVVGVFLTGCSAGCSRPLDDPPAPGEGPSHAGLGWGIAGYGSFLVPGRAQAGVDTIVSSAYATRRVDAAEVYIDDETIRIRLQNPDHRDEFDDYSVDLNGTVTGPKPVRRSSGDGLETATFPLENVHLDRVAGMRRQALAAPPAAGDELSAHFVDLVVEKGPGTGTPRVLVGCKSARHDWKTEFDASGSLVGTQVR